MTELKSCPFCGGKPYINSHPIAQRKNNGLCNADVVQDFSFLIGSIKQSKHGTEGQVSRNEDRLYTGNRFRS